MTSNHPPSAPAGQTRRSRSARQSGTHRHHGTEPAGQLSPEACRLARAATDLDTGLVQQIMLTSVAGIGVVSAWEQLLQPVWQYLGSQADGGHEHAVAEHLYVQAALTALSRARRPSPASPPSVLLACTDEETQVFPLEVLVGALEESGASCSVLGARVPPSALAAAATRLRPTAVIIWSQTRLTADPAQISTVLRAHPATTILAAGPGWNNAALPPQAVRPMDLSTALVLTLAALEEHAWARHPVPRPGRLARAAAPGMR